MKNWHIFALVLVINSSYAIGQDKAVSRDSTLNRLTLKTLNMTIASGRGNEEDYYN